MEIIVGAQGVINSWSTLVSEFGTDKDGDIACRPYFFNRHRKYCGKECTITAVNKHDITVKVEKEQFDVHASTFELIDTKVKIGHIITTSISQIVINKRIDEGFIIKTFANDVCIMEYAPNKILK